MKYLARYTLILLVGVFIGFGITLERAVLAERSSTDAEDTLPLSELQNFAEILSRIRSDYVEPVKDVTLIEDAIRGMLAGLDPHSAYLNPEAYREIRVSTEGEFGGLGIEVTMEDGFVKVVTPIDDTPAAKAGVLSGDLIVRIDDTPVKGLSLADAVKLMRGKPGSDIKLSIVRSGDDSPREITVTRAVIKIRSVKNRMLEDGYGYIRVSQFQANTGEALRKAIKKLKKASKGKLKGLVLDLRNNPGGVLNAAVAVSDAFIKSGKIVYTQGRVNDSKLNFNATPTDLLDNTPIVTLVNGGSASASEIVAGALQDQKRAIIMGTKTFGKGSVQTILPMKNGSALKITTARYYTPNGRSIQATGITPDVIVEPLKLPEIEKKKSSGVREADLAKHLKNPNGKGDKKTKGPDKAIHDDYQLQEALNLLKGVNIARTRISDGA
ncbi:MAG: S41 family peptidase [Gammaproteobacteria bacterium]|nr:S41 family peptidase [Gammaproteobacteria bacterium]